MLSNSLILAPMIRFYSANKKLKKFLHVELAIKFFSLLIGNSNNFCFSQQQGPFDTFLVGGDKAEVCDIKFSNDGKSMLLSTTNNNIYVLDAYTGDKVVFTIRFLMFKVRQILYYSACISEKYIF